jgi:hypothetical protein
MAPQNPAGARAPPNVTTRNSSHQSRTQSDVFEELDVRGLEIQPEEQNPEIPESDDNDATHIREQIHVLEERSRNQDTILAQILSRLTALQDTSQNPSGATPHSLGPIERRSHDSETLSSPRTGFLRHSKKQPDPNPLSDGVNPTFESWKIQIQGKLRVNADHYDDEEAKMLYLFGRTTGDAQKHLQPRYDEDSPTRFQTAKEMVQYLASIYVDPNKARNARYEYNRLVMKTGQPFAEFQTQFLHLASEAQIPPTSLRMDLYDRLTTQLQRSLAANLRSLASFEELVADCLSVDAELRRITAREDKEKRFRKATSASVTPTTILPASGNRSSALGDTPGLLPAVKTTTTRASVPRHTTPNPSSVTCYNCDKIGHYASSCPEPRKGDLKEIEEEEEESDGTDDESGKGEP